jgi:hypothetical protein
MPEPIRLTGVKPLGLAMACSLEDSLQELDGFRIVEPTN